VRTDVGEFRGRFLVGADGAHSVFHRDLGLRVARDTSRIGLSTHVRGFPATPGVVSITSLPEGEVYVTPVDGGLVLAALLVERSASPRPSEVTAFLARRMRCASVLAAGPVLAAYPLSIRVRPTSGRGWILLGDSAGKIDPVSGQGLSLALAGGAVAARVLDAALEGNASPGDVERLLRPRRRSARRLTRMLLMASRHPEMARRLLPRAALPEGHLLRAAVGLEGYSWLRAARDLLGAG
jgi:flavin-dependent dehydrogenase